MIYTHLWYAEVIEHLSVAQKALEQAGCSAVRASDQELFKKLHEKRMELWDLVKDVMQKGGAVK